MQKPGVMPLQKKGLLFERHQVFDSTVLEASAGISVVDSKWILTIKLNVDGSINKYKARLL